jgi:hypothetical protein
VVDESGTQPRVRLREAVLVVVGALLAAFVYTFPLVRHFREAIPYAYAVAPERRVQDLVPGDHLQFLYFLSVTADMVSGRSPWFEDPYEFAAPDPSPRKSFFFLPFSLVFAAMAPLGQATAYNVLVVLSFPATALATYWLARSIGATPPAAAIAGGALTLLPYRLANVAGGHPTGLAFFLVPLALYSVETAWQRARAGPAWGGALCFAILAVNEPHLLYFCAFLLPAWVAFAIWRLEPSRHPRATAAVWLWLGIAAAGPTIATAIGTARHHEVTWTVTDLALLYGALLAMIAVAWRFTAELRVRAETAAAGAAEPWIDEARSYAPLGLLGLYAVQLIADVSHLGLLLLAIAATWIAAAKAPLARSLLRLLGREHRRLWALWPVAAGLAVGALLLFQYKSAFIDPSGRAAERSVQEIRLFAPQPSDFVRRSGGVLTRQMYAGAAVLGLAAVALAAREGRALGLFAAAFAVLSLGPHAPPWLPLYAGATRLVPFFGIIRQPPKLFAVTAIALALAAAIGFDLLLRTLSRRRRLLVAIVALAAILVDFSLVLPFGVSRLPRTNRAYDLVAQTGRGANVLELPLWPGDSAFSSIYQYWAARTRVPIVNGYSPTAPRDYVGRIYRPLESMNLGELDEPQHRLLDDLRVRFVTLHRDTFPPQVSIYPYRFTLAAMRRNPNFRELTADRGVFLFERVLGGYRPWESSASWPMGVFYEAESLKLGAGERIADAQASGGAAIRGRPGEEMPVVYGPYRPLPAGAYEARFRVRGRGRVEVSADRGTKALAAARADVAAWSDVTVPFATTQSHTIEFRAWPLAQADGAFDVDWVLLTKLAGAEERNAGARRFEAEDLIALYGDDREADDASGGAYAVIVDYPPGAVVRDGPYRLYPAGRWRVTVRWRRGPLELRVEPADGRIRLLDVEVPSTAEWTEAGFDVTLAAPAVLCTRLISAGREADVDYVDISAPPPESAAPAVEATAASGVLARR